ncbi:hypothetical protein [Caenispirillum bisanense]|uniref:hypothetical protein n=1 Tax=Caenispirillum bisanense TaxID=414052 RepID=UPI000BE241AC|nr:hypothetical protein [Caenispirillum bisanense]
MIEKFDRAFLREKVLTSEVNKTPEAKERGKVRLGMNQLVREVGKSSDIDLILAVERCFLENDLAEYANSKGMADSLAAAIAELGSAERHVQLVAEGRQR